MIVSGLVTLSFVLSSALPLALPLPTAAPRGDADSVRVCIRDAVSGVSLVGATVRDGRGRARVFGSDCGTVAQPDTVQVARVGYTPQTVPVIAADDSSGTPRALVVLLAPRASDVAAVGAASGARLAAVRVNADAVPSAPAGMLQTVVSSDAARERGLPSVNGLLALMPFTAVRSSRGESGVSLRGARREQVIITLDGLPLNDPSTGVADVADLPLVAVQQAVVRPGSDPVGAGSGAVGGVLALTSASQRLASVRAGAFGQWSAEAAWAAVGAAARWNLSVSHRRAANDFPFVNDAGVSPVREWRVNNDESRTVVTAGVVRGGTQWSALVSTGERGMVGPANVRAYDEDRARTTRVLVRGQTAVGSALLTTGLRHFVLGYRDPSHPTLDSRAVVWAADAEWRADAPVGAWRVGAGTDVLVATGNVRQQRTRGFAAWAWRRPAVPHTGPSSTSSRRLDVDLGVRLDAIERSGVQPSGSVGGTWRLLGRHAGSSVSWVARTAQAVRVPTLYDLYFSSPQRLAVRPLAPERVPFDVGSGLQAVWQRGGVRVVGEAQAVARDTRNAIVWFPGNFGWSPANVGRERLRGTEARAELTTASVSIGGWHTWYESTLRSGALTIPTPYVARHTAGAQAAWRWGRHTISTNVRVQGRRPFTAGPRNPLFELPAVTLADIAWARQHDIAHLRALVSVTLENATNVRWQSVRGFPMPGRGWSAALTLQPRP